MQYLKTYLQKIIDRGNPLLADSIKNTAEDVGNQYIKTFSFSSHEIGLLFGNVQSGKTGQMFGIICKAADLGFPVFVLLTGFTIPAAAKRPLSQRPIMSSSPTALNCVLLSLVVCALNQYPSSVITKKGLFFSGYPSI